MNFKVILIFANIIFLSSLLNCMDKESISDKELLNKKTAIAISQIAQNTHLSPVTNILGIQNIIAGYLENEWYLHAQFDECDGHITTLAFSPDGRYLAAGKKFVQYGLIKIWDLNSLSCILSLDRNNSGHIDWVNALTFSPDGKYLASSSHDKTIKIFDMNTKSYCYTLSNNNNGHNAIIRALAYSPDGRYLASGSDDGKIKILYMLEKSNIHCIATINNNYAISELAFSPDGKYLACGSTENISNSYITIWDRNNLNNFYSKTHYNCQAINALTYSPDSKFLACVSNFINILVPIPRIHREEIIQRLKQNTKVEEIFRKSFQDNKFLVLDTSEMQFGSYSHTKSVNKIAYCPNGRYLASGSSDQTIKIWDTHKYHCVFNLDKNNNGHTEAVVNIAFSPDGRYLGSGSSDGTIKIWANRSHKLLEPIDQEPKQNNINS